jgi:hypothetical protein
MEPWPELDCARVIPLPDQRGSAPRADPQPGQFRCHAIASASGEVGGLLLLVRCESPPERLGVLAFFRMRDTHALARQDASTWSAGLMLWLPRKKLSGS